MRTVNLRDGILWPVARLHGFDPAKDLFNDFALMLESSLNTRVVKYWDCRDWPELSITASRTVTGNEVAYGDSVYIPPDWVGGDTYNLDQVVTDPDDSTKVYISLQNVNFGNALSDGDWWELVEPWDSTKQYLVGDKVSDPANGIVYVAKIALIPSTSISRSLTNQNAWEPLYTQMEPGQQTSTIGKVLKVYQVDPRVFDGPFDIPFRLMEQTIHVGFTHGPTVWIKYMTRAPQFSLTPWVSTQSYSGSTGDGPAPYSALAYDIVTGDCYRSVNASNINHPPSTTPAWWQPVQIPLVIAQPLVWGIYSDVLRDEGQHLKAAQAEQRAEAEIEMSVMRNLAPRYDQLTTQQSGTPLFKANIPASTLSQDVR